MECCWQEGQKLRLRNKRISKGEKGEEQGQKTVNKWEYTSKQYEVYKIGRIYYYEIKNITSFLELREANQWIQVCLCGMSVVPVWGEQYYDTAVVSTKVIQVSACLPL